MFKFVKLKKNVDKIVDNNGFNNYSTSGFGPKNMQFRRIVDKNRSKKRVIHIVSTNCGYWDSNNVEMWINGNTPIYCKKKFLRSISRHSKKLIFMGFAGILYLTRKIKIYIMVMLFTTQNSWWPAGEPACEDFSF